MKRTILVAQQTLREAGYLAPTTATLIAAGFPIKKVVLAYGADDEGDVMGKVAAIAIFESTEAPDSLLAEDCARLLEAKFGTTLNYLLLGDSVLIDSKGKATPLSEGVTRHNGSSTPWKIFDPDLIFQIINDELRSESTFRDSRKYSKVLNKLTQSEGFELDGKKVSISKSLFLALWSKVVTTAIKSDAIFWSTPREVNAAIAAIAVAVKSPKTVLDPFLGIGDTLISVAANVAGSPTFFGWEINPEILEDARIFLNRQEAFGHFDMTLDASNTFLKCTNSLTEDWPKVDLIVSIPPFGLRLSEPCLGPSFVTRDGEIAIIDKAMNALNPGGRAVLLTTRGWTTKSGDATKLREVITSRNDINVSALVGLPGVLPGTAIEPCIVVIDRVTKGETLVAELGADWQDQLAKDGPIVSELRG